MNDPFASLSHVQIQRLLQRIYSGQAFSQIEGRQVAAILEELRRMPNRRRDDPINTRYERNRSADEQEQAQNLADEQQRGREGTGG